MNLPSAVSLIKCLQQVKPRGQSSALHFPHGCQQLKYSSHHLPRPSTPISRKPGKHPNCCAEGPCFESLFCNLRNLCVCFTFKSTGTLINQIPERHRLKLKMNYRVLYGSGLESMNSFQKPRQASSTPESSASAVQLPYFLLHHHQGRERSKVGMYISFYIFLCMLHGDEKEGKMIYG